MKSKGFQPQTELPSLEHQCQEKEPQQHPAVKNSGIPSTWVGQEAAGNPGVLLKGPHTDSLTGAHPGLQQMDGDSGGARDTQGENELCGFRAMAGGTATTVPVLIPPPVQPTGWHHLSCVEPSPNTTKYESASAW